MAVHFSPDQGRRRMVVTVTPRTTWTSFQREVLKAVEQAPYLTDWDWIIDDQEPIEDVDVEGMMQIGSAFRRHASSVDQRTITVVVTDDRHFDNWARVMDHNYGSRQHMKAADLAEAHALLDRANHHA
jgi:hypothetical protein